MNWQIFLQYLSPALSFIVGAAVLWLFLRFTRRAEDSQREHVENKRRAIPVETSSPIDRPYHNAKQTALRGMGNRFTIIRRGGILLFLFILFLVAVLPSITGLSATAISALLALLGAIVAVAARPVLENLVSGVMITFSGVVREADTIIIDKHYGTIEDITLTHTIVRNWDWRRYVIPNATLLTKEFLNLTLRDNHHWRHVEFWVDPEADLEVVEREAIAAAEDSSHFSRVETPSFWVMEMGKEGLRCWIAAWADSPAQSWELSHDICTNLSRRLRQAGVRLHRFNVHFGERPPGFPEAS